MTKYFKFEPIHTESTINIHIILYATQQHSINTSDPHPKK